MLLVAGGIGFAVSNAIVEGIIFRGILYDALCESLKHVPAIITQALLFGLWHYNGFLGGLSGMSLVFIWGIFPGIMRFRSGGMVYSVVTHIAADFTIFTIIFFFNQA